MQLVLSFKCSFSSTRTYHETKFTVSHAHQTKSVAAMLQRSRNTLGSSQYDNWLNPVDFRWVWVKISWALRWTNHMRRVCPQPQFPNISAVKPFPFSETHHWFGCHQWCRSICKQQKYVAQEKGADRGLDSLSLGDCSFGSWVFPRMVVEVEEWPPTQWRDLMDGWLQWSSCKCGDGESRRWNRVPSVKLCARWDPFLVRCSPILPDELVAKIPHCSRLPPPCSGHVPSVPQWYPCSCWSTFFFC